MHLLIIFFISHKMVPLHSLERAWVRCKRIRRTQQIKINLRLNVAQTQRRLALILQKIPKLSFIKGKRKWVYTVIWYSPFLYTYICSHPTKRQGSVCSTRMLWSPSLLLKEKFGSWLGLIETTLPFKAWLVFLIPASTNWRSILSLERADVSGLALQRGFEIQSCKNGK